MYTTIDIMASDQTLDIKVLKLVANEIIKASCSASSLWQPAGSSSTRRSFRWSALRMPTSAQAPTRRTMS